MITIIFLCSAIFLAAFIYSSIGHGGATAYLAVMSFFGLLPEEMRITALILNVIVAGIGTVNYCQRRELDWGNLWPFIFGSIPFTLIGSSIIPTHFIYDKILGIVLIISGSWIFIKKSDL